LILPPIYSELWGGEIPLFVSHLVFLGGAASFLFGSQRFRFRPDPVGHCSLWFLFSLAFSLPFAFWLSGPQQGTASVLKYLLLLQPFLLYFWLRGLPWIHSQDPFRYLLRAILIFGTISALYGIVDFMYPIPIPHPFADQYIYLFGQSVRRAQGVFYEASSFGNLCAFFWSLCLVTLSSSAWKVLKFSRIWLGLLVGIFTVALFLSYSRGSWVNALLTVAIFFFLQRGFKFRLPILAILLSGIFLVSLYLWYPELVTNFFEKRLGGLLEFWKYPDAATSGRWETWRSLFGYFAGHPGLLLFGVGYKSIASTDLFRTNLIADNGYLSLLFETGILGLSSWFVLLMTLLRQLLDVRYRGSPIRSLYASFLFAFWCGQMVQMLTGDILTYWRNLVVYFSMAAVLIEPWNSEP
ncbi:MAG TPA: O-antigen ligase family protein, partial [Terriglobia bacterium]|nr:O-antigen ligase family protein [Terriglobia bacterium]